MPANTAKSSAARPAQPAIQPILLPSFQGMAPRFGALPVSSGPFRGCLMQVPGPPQNVPQADQAAPHSKAAAKASIAAQEEANNFAVPVIGAGMCPTRAGTLAKQSRPEPHRFAPRLLQCADRRDLSPGWLGEHMAQRCHRQRTARPRQQQQCTASPRRLVERP